MGIVVTVLPTVILNRPLQMQYFLLFMTATEVFFIIRFAEMKKII